MGNRAGRLLMTLVVAGAGLALVRGLVLTTYVELTPQAQADAEQGRLWLWAVTVMLVLTVVAAARQWQVPPWSLAALAVAAPLGLVADALDWIPLVALFVSGPLLLIGLTGALLAPEHIDHRAEGSAG